eukprot:COSAG04_NODE_2216_length_4513_cov_3.037155_6_plen_56_part_00
MALVADPSLGHMAHQNMTTLCENWACTFHEAGGGSQNRKAFSVFACRCFFPPAHA